MSDLDPYEEILLLSFGMRHVRTVEGAEYFHLPVGAIITPEELEAAKAEHASASQAEWLQDGKENWAAGRAARWAKGVPGGALGSKADAEKSAAAYAKNPSATIFHSLPSHHPYNLPTDHPRHLTPPASEQEALTADHVHHLVSGNPDEQFVPHPSSLTGPNEFSVGPMKYNVPAGSRLYQPKGLSNVRILITPDETVHAFTHVGEVDVPMDLQQAFADVLPPGTKGNDLYQTKNFDVAAPVHDALKKHINDTHDTKAAARYAAALVQNDHANAAVAAASPQPKDAPPVATPQPMTAAEAGQHASITGALMHAHPGAELVNSEGETEFIKQPDGTWKHALFNATVDESTVQKLVSAGELHIKGEAPGLTHDFKSMSKDQWLAFLKKAPVGAKFQIDGKDMVKGPDNTWNGIPHEKMGTLRLLAKNFEDGSGPAIPKETPPNDPWAATHEPWKESPVPNGPDKITALQIKIGDKIDGAPVTKVLSTEVPGRVRVITKAEDGTIQEHSWLKTTQVGVERANHGPSFDEKYPNASNGKPNTGTKMEDFTNTPGGGTAGQGLNTPPKNGVEKPSEAAPTPTPPKNDNLATPEFKPFNEPKESDVGPAAGSGAGGNQPASGHVEPAGSGNVPAHAGGNGNADAGANAGSSEGVAGLGHPDGNGIGPGVVPAEIIKSELPQSDAIKAMAAKGLVTPQVVELDSQKGAQHFHDAIAALKENNPHAASVYVHPVDEYKGMRLFLTHDGTSGFALDGNNAVSLFINPNSPHKGGSVAMLTMQTELGAQRLDAFDTKLPGIYAKVGYIPVARVHWDDQFAPEGWDKALYQNYNHGEPDVVFMVHDPAHSDGTYHPGEGKAFASYDQAEAFTKKAALDPSLANSANAVPGETHHHPGEILSHQDLKSLPPGHTVEHTPSETKYSSQGQGKFLSHKSNVVGDIGLMKTAADAGKIAYHSNNQKTATEVKAAEAVTSAADKAPEPSGTGGGGAQPPAAPAAAEPAPVKKSGPAMKKASDLTKGDKIATGIILGVDHINAPKGKVHVYYHNHKGILQLGTWNKNTMIGYEAPKAEAPKVEAPKVEAPKVEAPKTPTPDAVADVAEAKQLWENGPSFSTKDIQEAHDALKNAGAFQVSYGFKSIPDNPLASQQAELKAEAKKKFPTMQPKAAVIKLLHNQLSPEQKAESKSEEVAKIHIGAKEPKPTQQGFNGGDYTAEEIQHAIQALEGDSGKLVKSILNKASSPLGELSPITLPEVGFNKDKTITKQKFIDHLKSLLPKETTPKKVTVRPEKDITTGTVGTPLEKEGRFVAPVKAVAPPKKVTVRPEKDITTGTFGTSLEKEGRFKAKPKAEALPHEPGDLLTGDQVKALPDGHVITWHTHDGAHNPDVQHFGSKAGDKFNNDHGTTNQTSTLAMVADTHDPNATTPMKKNGVHYAGGPGTTKLAVSKYKNAAVEAPKLPAALENFDKPEGLQPGDHIDQAAFEKLVPGDQVKVTPTNTNHYTLQHDGAFHSDLTGTVYDKSEMNPYIYQGMAFHGHTDVSESAPAPVATPAVTEAEMQAHDQAVAETHAWTPATQDQINDAGVGSEMILHSVSGNEYPFVMQTNGKWHNSVMGEFHPDSINAGTGNFEMTKQLKKAPSGDPKTVEHMLALPEKTALTYNALPSGTTYDAARTADGMIQISGLGYYSPEGLKPQIENGQFHVEHIPAEGAHPLTPSEVAALGVGSRIFYSGGFGRVMERKPDGLWETPGGQVIADVMGIGTAPIFLVSEADKGNPENFGYSPEILDAAPNSVVTYMDGAVAKKMAYAWSLYNDDGSSGGALNPSVVAADVAEGHAVLTHTPTVAQPFAPGKYISNGKAAMHVLPDGTGVYVASTGTTSKLSKANVLKNHDAGMSNYLGTGYEVPEVVAKEAKAPGAVTKAPTPVPTSKDIPDGSYYLKSKAGDSITVTNGQVSKNGESIGDLKKLKLAFNKGQILDLNGTSITPVGYSGAVSLLDTPTTIPALLDLQKYLDEHPGVFNQNWWQDITATLTSAGFPLSLGAFIKAFNDTVTDPEKKANSGWYWLSDVATSETKQAMRDFFASQVANLLSKVDTAIPEANTSALFDWTVDGQAKPPLQLVSIPKANYNTSPASLNAYVKQITEALGAQKIFNLAGMTKYNKMDWVNAVKKGNFATAYQLEVEAHANKGKAHPSGFLHPGYSGNEATNHIQWGAAVEGEVPAGVPVEGNWTSIGVAASAEELQNYLISAHMQHPEHLTLSQQRSWVTYHRTGDKQSTDQLSAMAAMKAQNGDPAISPTPVWTDNVQPAKSYAVWFDQTPFPTEGDLYNGPSEAPGHYLQDNVGNAELQKSWDAWSSPYKNNYSGLQDLAQGSFGTQKKFLNDHFTRLREEAAAEEAKPKFSLVKEIAQGQHPAYLVEDHGNQYIFKPVDPGKDYRAEIEAAAVHLGALWGFTEPTASVQSLPTATGEPLLGGQVGILQSLIPNVGNMNFADGPVDIASLHPKQLGQIAAEHVLDWAIDNNDGHGDNLLMTPAGDIVGIDKGRAFAAFGTWDGLDGPGMNYQAQTIASKLFSLAKVGVLTQEQMDAAYKAALKAANKISKSSDAAAVSIIEKGLANRPHYQQGPGSKEAVIKAFLARKHGIVDDINKLWEGIYAKSGLTKPEPPVKALNEDLQSGFHEPDLSAAIQDKAVWGVTTFHASPDIKKGSVLIWQEKNSNGDPVAKGLFAVNKYAEGKLLSWLDGHVSSDTSGSTASAQSLTNFPNMEPFRKALSTAGKEVSSHLVDGVVDQAVMDKFQETKNQLLADAQFGDSLHATAGQGTAPIKFPSGNEVDPGALGQYRAAINHYLNAANEVEQAQKEQRQTEKSMFGLYQPIAAKAVPAIYLNPEKGLAYTELTSGDFITNKGVVVPASQLPDGAKEGLNGWTSVNGAQQSDGVTVVKEHAGDLSGSLDYNGLKLQSNDFSTYGHNGDEYVVHLPTGEYIRFRNSDHTSTDQSQWDQIRFRLSGADREASLSRVESVLNQMGLDMAGAEPEHAQDIYWKEMFGSLIGSNGNMPSAQKQVVADLAAMIPDLAAEHGVTSTYGESIPTKHLIEALGASKTVVPDQHQFWHDKAVEAFGQKKVDEWLAAENHLPQFQHFDLANPDKTTGHAFWNRLDFTLEHILAKKTLVGQGTMGKDKSLANFIKSGNAISTEERLRMLGVFGHGISKESDQPKGGANYVFLRTAYDSAKYEGAAGFGPYVVYWNPALFLHTGTKAFNYDAYGEQDSLYRAQADIMKALRHGNMDNETDIQNAVSVFDYMEIMIFDNADNRNDAIQKMKALGHAILRGVPIEERLIMRSEVNKAMETVMNAWGSNA